MDREAGASMVEAAIFAPIVMFMLFAAIMGGIYLGDTVSLQWATRSGARAASVGGANAFTDYDILAAVEQSTQIFPKSYIDTIVVYHADSFSSEPSPACKAGIAVPGNSVGSCNVYSVADFNRPATDFGLGGWNGDDPWLPETRKTSGFTGTDYVGVYVRARCTCVASMFNASEILHSNTVMRIEPKEA